MEVNEINRPNRVRKSRYGCRNCKLRKVKCDETRPHCLRCRTYGVQRNFNLDTTDLQPLKERREQPRKQTQPHCTPLRPSIDNAIWADDGMSFFKLDQYDWDLFSRFRHRTLYSLGGSDIVQIYEDHMLKASFTCPFLLHGTLAVAAVHDGYLSLSPTVAHCENHTTGLNPKDQEEHKDPIWTTTGTLSILAFASINAVSTNDAWPLGSPDCSNLEWLRLGSGKMSLWNLVDPLRPGSAFRVMIETLIRMRKPLPIRGTEGVPEDLENNVYFTVVHSLSRFLDVPQENVALGDALMVSNYMHNKFEDRLRNKDPIALLLLCLWYAKARRVRWRIDFRARFELPAICNYLQRYHGGDTHVQSLIPWEEVGYQA
ncbi:hypothetical protein N7493_009624 [Penicillium malachiteum]|uniref:Zn(2)-C6 fungal-type domain-containing protein n=1 Tax=Penicillium malachiteum TaxID=1324776 RepID=A0AAD6MSF8_9EURO|nr:hypothetical protein N7493_009624 [Penicillium malachiteum]